MSDKNSKETKEKKESKATKENQSDNKTTKETIIPPKAGIKEYNEKKAANAMETEMKKIKDDKNESEKEPLFFERKEETDTLTLWNLDIYLRKRLSPLGLLLTYIIEFLIIVFILFLPSVYYIFYEANLKDFFKFFSSPGPISFDRKSVFRFSLFIAICFGFDSLIWIIMKDIIIICNRLLIIFSLQESELLWRIIDNFNCAKEYLAVSLVFLFIFLLSDKMFTKYKAPNIKDIGDINIIKGLILWYGIYMGLMFIMQIILYEFIYDLKRSSYSKTIFDLNNKLFIFQKLKIISEASSSDDRNYISENMDPGYDPGFYLIGQDFFQSKEDAGIVAENIMALLKKNKIIYKDLKVFFPTNPDKVFKFLSGSDSISDEQAITVTQFKNIAQDLYSKREDMSRTLKDRNYIFEKLEFIFSLGVKYIAAIVLCMIFKLDYKFYLATFGTSLFTFSWIFGDTIKNLFNCFVFILITRPFDIGDRVEIDGLSFKVYKINLLNTAFLTNLQKLVYIPNAALIQKSIFNLSRSPPEYLRLELSIDHSTTTVSKAIKLSEKMKNHFKKNKEFVSGLDFMDLANEKLYFKLYINQNFHNYELLDHIKIKIIKAFEEGMQSEHISYKNHFMFNH